MLILTRLKMKNQAIKKAIDIAGGQKKLAVLCGVSQPTVWRWLNGGGVDARLVMSIVKATGNQLTPAEIRPDLYELIGTNKSVEQLAVKQDTKTR